MAGRVASDPYREIDDRLYRWAEYRRIADQTPTGGFKSSLGMMQGEAAAIQRGDRKVGYGIESAKMVLASLLRRIKVARLRLKDAELAKNEPAIVEQREVINRLSLIARAFPKTTNQLAWAALIHGKGLRPDRDYPEEEETQVFFMSLPVRLRRVMHRNWVNTRHQTQEQHARDMHMGYSTFRAHVADIRKRLYRHIWRKGD